MEGEAQDAGVVVTLPSLNPCKLQHHLEIP